MRLLRLIPLAALFLVGACDEEGAVKNATYPPLAYVRYVNAVPDIDTIDFKFIDDVEFSPSYAATRFRSVGIYQGARAGSRQVRVFRHTDNINTTQTVLANATLNLTAGTYYTILHAGYVNTANGPEQALIVIDDTRPAQGTGLHMSLVNTRQGLANPDVFICHPNVLTILGGDGQTGTAGAFLTDSIRFQLTDDCGNLLGGESVVFTVATGGGSVTNAASAQVTSATLSTGTTGAALGLAGTRWRLGATVGAQTLSVTSGQAGPITVNATATAPPIVAGLSASASRAETDSPQTAATGAVNSIAPGSPILFTNVAAGTRTAYSNVPLGRFWLRTAATGTTVELAVAAPIAGSAGTTSVDPVAGYNQAGTQFSAFFFPASIAGSGAASFTTAGITIVADRQPPRTVPD
jgi:hypothetical protein